MSLGELTDLLPARRRVGAESRWRRLDRHGGRRPPVNTPRTRPARRQRRCAASLSASPVRRRLMLQPQTIAHLVGLTGAASALAGRAPAPPRRRTRHGRRQNSPAGSGDRAGLVCRPAGLWGPDHRPREAAAEAIGFEVRVGEHARQRHGYFAGTESAGSRHRHVRRDGHRRHLLLHRRLGRRGSPCCFDFGVIRATRRSSWVTATSPRKPTPSIETAR